MAAPSPLMNTMIRAAEKAARVLRRDFSEVEQLQVSRKGPGDFVTAADKRSEEILFEELKKTHPTFSFMMEESGTVKGDDSDNVWIIDPIDGTHNFMHAIPHWCISIALEREGNVIAGLVYDPVKDELFRAEKGLGAYLHSKRIRASGRHDMESAMIACGFQGLETNARDAYFKELQAVTAQASMVRRYGAAALDLCYVAAGRLDGYWERGLKPWDCAAGVLIVKEAGGISTPINKEGNPIYTREIVAGNSNFHSALRQILRQAK